MQFLQMDELCLRKYSVVILDGGFLTHSTTWLGTVPLKYVKVSPDTLIMAYTVNAFRIGRKIVKLHAQYVNTKNVKSLTAKHFFLDCGLQLPKYNPSESLALTPVDLNLELHYDLFMRTSFIHVGYDYQKLLSYPFYHYDDVHNKLQRIFAKRLNHSNVFIS